MRQSIKNYTTTIPANKTVAEIMDILVAHGVTEVRTQWRDGHITALLFACEGLGFELPARVDQVRLRLCADRVKNKDILSAAQTTEEHAEKVAWRNLKDWVDAQFALIDTGMVTVPEVFLPYLMINGASLFKQLEQRQFLLAAAEHDRGHVGATR